MLTDEVEAIDRWLAKQSDRIRDEVSNHVLSGGKASDPACVRLVGEGHAYHRARSFISGARRFKENSRGTD